MAGIIVDRIICLHPCPSTLEEQEVEERGHAAAMDHPHQTTWARPPAFLPLGTTVIIVKEEEETDYSLLLRPPWTTLVAVAALRDFHPRLPPVIDLVGMVLRLHGMAEQGVEVELKVDPHRWMDLPHPSTRVPAFLPAVVVTIRETVKHHLRCHWWVVSMEAAPRRPVSVPQAVGTRY